MTRASVDTGVFVALFAGDEESTPWAQRALEGMAVRSVLAVSPVVYTELVAGGRSPEAVEMFFAEKGIEVDWEIGREVWRTAGSRYGSYARDRKRRDDDAGPRRILADFLVSAHALHLGGRTLLTTNTRIFANRFPELQIVAPEGL